MLQKITGGKFFLVGHKTKNKTNLALASSEAATCTTTGVDDFTFTNATASVTTQT